MGEPKINEAGVDAILKQYRQVCIMQNAFEHDTGGYNDNYEQRRLGIEMVFDAFHNPYDAYSKMMWIEKEVRNQVWHQDYDEHGCNKYVQLH